MIAIPSNLYSSQLLTHLYPLVCQENENWQDALLINRICKANLVDKCENGREYIDKIRLSNFEKEIIFSGNYCNSDNLEIKARCNDVMRNGSKSYREMSVIASESYFALYKQDDNYSTLVRSLVIRGMSNIDTSFIDSFLSVIEKRVVYSHVLDRIISYLTKSTTITFPWKYRLITYIGNRMKAELLTDSYKQYRGYKKNMYLLGELSLEERERDIALAYELEADKALVNKKPNTVYMGLDQLYKKGLKRITPYRNKYQDIYDRLWNKLCRQQQYYADMMKRLPPYRMSISEDMQNKTHHWIDNIEIKSLIDIVQMYLDLFSIKEQRSKVVKEEKGTNKYSIFSSWGTAQQDRHGNTVGIESPEDSRKLNKYKDDRFYLQYFLAVAINHAIKSEIKITRNDVVELLVAVGSKYIDNSRFGLIAEGLYYGFTYNFVVAAHLLIPQLEHFLHDVDEQVLNKDLTKLTQDRQEEYTLEQVLTDLKQMNEPLFDELDFFLCHGSDVNFRNKLVHGLMDLPEMEHYAPFFWWNCLCLFLKVDKLIENS